MNATSSKADITLREMNRELTYDSMVMLSLSIEYPEVRLADNRKAQIRINKRYRTQVFGFYRYATNTLYREAVREYKDAQKNGFPFRQFDAVLKYIVTLNQDCYLSNYYDRYEYRGGAHGGTTRASDTWNIKTGKRLSLSDLFQPGEDYQALILQQILMQADKNMQQNPGIYFEDYRELIVKNFNPASFYLTYDGINIYYQQYDIAPYSSGMVTFMIPYEIVQWVPSCF